MRHEFLFAAGACEAVEIPPGTKEWPFLPGAYFGNNDILRGKGFPDCGNPAVVFKIHLRTISGTIAQAPVFTG